MRPIPAMLRMSHPLSKFYLPCLQILDHVLLLQMGRTYLARFRGFAEAAEIEGLPAVERWRVEQQAEWNRLSNTLAFLATMSAAILAISPPAPPLAFSVWLGAAGLSVCGLFIVQYFPIQAFSISDEDMGKLVKDGNYINSALLAIAVASPVIIALWSSILFAIGIVDYIIENSRDKQFMLLSLVPVAIGFVASAAVMIIGSIIGQRIQARYKRGTLRTRWRRFPPDDGEDCVDLNLSASTQTSVGTQAPIDPSISCTIIQSS